MSKQPTDSAQTRTHESFQGNKPGSTYEPSQGNKPGSTYEPFQQSAEPRGFTDSIQSLTIQTMSSTYKGSTSIHHPLAEHSDSTVHMASTAQGFPTPQQKADAHRQTMLDESQWFPDYSDCKTPSAEDIQHLLQQSGIQDNPNLTDEKDNVCYWFANKLLTDNWPLVDGVLRQAGPTQMKIEHTQVINKPGYRINHPDKLEAIQYIIKDLLEKDIIVPANSPYSSPALIVPKKHKQGETDIHKKWRFVSDYRALNAVTITDTYKPPPIDMLLTATAGAKYYTFLDLEKGFWQLPIEKESQAATAFTIPGIGVYQFKRVVMGLKNSSAVFQRHVDRMMVGLAFRTCVAFVDDICIYSNTIQEHKIHVYEVFQRLVRHGHSIRLDKCSFFQIEHEFLGYVISQNGIKPSPMLVSGLTEMKHPTTIKELRAWIGMMNYQRRFIQNFAEKISPMHEATKAGPLFKSLTEDEKATFDNLTRELKEFCDQSRSMHFPDWTQPIEMETDASRHAIAGWAFQTINGRDGP